jgi:hypothetical protein
VTGGSRELNSEELYNLYSSSNVIRLTTSRTVRWALHLAYGQMRNEYNILVVNLNRRRLLENLGVDEIIILKWVLGKEGVRKPFPRN